MVAIGVCGYLIGGGTPFLFMINVSGTGFLLHRNHIGSGARRACGAMDHRKPGGFRGLWKPTAADDPGEGKGQHIWSLLPRFDPSTGSAREYIEKVKFIDGVCPKKDRSMLATRLDWQCCAEGRPGDKLKLSRRHHWWMGSTG